MTCQDWCSHIGFVDMLNEMRFGRLTPESIRTFESLSRPLKMDDGIEPTELFPLRSEVDKSNTTRLKLLNTTTWLYTGRDGGTVTDPAQRARLLANVMAPPEIILKVGAQVMLIKNVDDSLVNGSTGKILGFTHPPLFERGLDGKWLDLDSIDGFDWERWTPEEQERKQKLMRDYARMGTTPFPVVRFKIPGGGTRDVLVDLDVFKVEAANGEVQASRAQVGHTALEGG